eukprot:gnl/Chilomastix_cuspidata/3447.p1 GENE.gnl/Chilomastix_cuspidata/3447~~gnl/Chilomastix_cuspidata/3447.p1  ORF type:complete len:1089 (+),score=441.07 gnl/Chilomastix_cuspidata/3447:55-3321(+)
MQPASGFKPLRQPPKLHIATEVSPEIRIDPTQVELRQVAYTNRTTLFKAVCSFKNYAKSQNSFQLPVIIKVLAGTSLLSEINVATSLSDEHVYPCLGALKVHTELAAVGPAFQFSSLLEFLGAAEDLTPLDRLTLGVRVGRAVLALHDAGLLHGNLSPAAFVVTRGGAPQVTGLQFVHSLGTRLMSIPEFRKAVSVRYAAPEVLSNSAPSSTASDAFSFGLLLYLIAAGDEPFGGADLQAAGQDIVAGRFPKLPASSPFAATVTALLRRAHHERIGIRAAVAQLEEQAAYAPRAFQKIAGTSRVVYARARKVESTVRQLNSEVLLHMFRVKDRLEEFEHTRRELGRHVSAHEERITRNKLASTELRELARVAEGSLTQLADFTGDAAQLERAVAAFQHAHSDQGGEIDSLRAVLTDQEARIAEIRQGCAAQAHEMVARRARADATCACTDSDDAQASAVRATIGDHTARIRECMTKLRLLERFLEMVEPAVHSGPGAPASEGGERDATQQRTSTDWLRQLDEMFADACSWAPGPGAADGCDAEAASPPTPGPRGYSAHERLSDAEVRYITASRARPSVTRAAVDSVVAFLEDTSAALNTFQRNQGAFATNISKNIVGTDAFREETRALLGAFLGFASDCRARLTSLEARCRADPVPELSGGFARLSSEVPALTSTQVHTKGALQHFLARLELMEARVAHFEADQRLRGFEDGAPGEAHGSAVFYNAGAERHVRARLRHGGVGSSSMERFVSHIPTSLCVSPPSGGISPSPSAPLLEPLEPAELGRPLGCLRPSKFSAFPAAETLSFVVTLTDARRAAHKAVRLGRVEVSQPVELPFSHAPFTQMSATVSASGHLLFFDGSTHMLHATDMRRVATVSAGPFSNLAFVATHGDTVALGVLHSGALYRARLSEFVEAPSLACFEKHRVPFVASALARTDLCPATARVVYCGPDGNLVELDIETLTVYLHAARADATWVASTSGIDHRDACCVFNDGAAFFPFLADGTRGAQLGEIGDAVLYCIPSAADPGDISKAAWLDWNRTLYHGGEAVPFDAPIKPLKYHSLVRIFRDVFVAFDELTSKWVALRITVP